MENPSAFERFNKLNNILGWGNPDAKIIFIGIEEGGEWGIKSYYNDKDTVSNLNKIIYKVNLKESLNESEHRLLNEYINRVDNDITEKYINNIIPENSNIIFASGPPQKITQTFQKLFIDNLLCRYPKLNIVNVSGILKKDRENFDEFTENAIFLNLYPLGRGNIDRKISEYEHLFGTKECERFPNEIFSNQRKCLLKSFLRKKILEKNFKIIVFCKKSDEDCFMSLFKCLNVACANFENNLNLKLIFNKDRDIIILPHPTVINTNKALKKLTMKSYDKKVNYLLDLFVNQ